MVVPAGDGCAPFPAAEMGDLSFSRSCQSACPREDRQATFPGCAQALEAGGGWEKRDKDSAELLGNQEALPRPQIPPSRATTPILAREKPHQDTSCAPRRGCEGWRPRGQRQRLRLGTPELIPALGGGHEWGKTSRPGGQENLFHSEVEVSDPPPSQTGGNRVKRREKNSLKTFWHRTGSEPFTAEGPGSADPYQTQPSAG